MRERNKKGGKGCIRLVCKKKLKKGKVTTGCSCMITSKQMTKTTRQTDRRSATARQDDVPGDQNLLWEHASFLNIDIS